MEHIAEIQLAAIDTAADVNQLVAGFVPNKRFQHVSFANYRPDGRYPSQKAAAQRVQQFVLDLKRGENSGTSWLQRWLRASAQPKTQNKLGLYLDGGYGVGKTHLLAAAYHLAPEPKIYLSFAQLSHWLSATGLEVAVQALANHRLLCIDEFELDDVANTRAAAMFLGRLLPGPSARGAGGDSPWRRRRRGGGGPRIITTSNTLPDQLGQGRFEANFFQREIGQIAQAFSVVPMDGQDYRRRQGLSTEPELLSNEALRQIWAEFGQPGQGVTGGRSKDRKFKAFATFSELFDVLRPLHPIRYGRLVEPLAALFISNVQPLTDQADALRFVYLIEKVYDQRVQLFVSGSGALRDVYHPRYRRGGYRKKYERSLSRLAELLQESMVALNRRPA